VRDIDAVGRELEEAAVDTIEPPTASTARPEDDNKISPE
jgi:hypothetical protein